jgi:hypothetical protein
MTRSVYIIGAAGTGKSTFTSELLERMEITLDPLEELWAKRNSKALVTLRGHRMRNRATREVGMYLGVMRDEFPGSDGLDRATSPTGEAWLEGSGEELPQAILAEGATLATRRFLYALHAHTDLLVLALRCDPVVHDLRLLARGSGQVSSFVLSTVTKTENLVRDLSNRAHPPEVRWVDSDVEQDWDSALLQAEQHLAA